ncbi:MAG: YIP1 family protein [Lachnospiraceae bacterium]|nr:YIP1 family protein [Lachnospiraceae bacterium]
MAFCMYCGKQIEEGETCNCPESLARKATDTPTGMNDMNTTTSVEGLQNLNQMNGQNQPEMNPMYSNNHAQFEQIKQKSGALVKDVFASWISILKAPITAGKQMVQAKKFQTGIGLLVLQALLTGIFGILLCSGVNDILSFGSYFHSSDISINLFLAFLLTVIGSLLMSAARVGLLFGGIKIFKGTADWQNLVCICGVRAVGVSLVQIVSIVLYFLNPFYGVMFFVFASATGVIFSLPCILECTGVSNDKSIYMMIAIAILLLVVLYILYQIGLPMYVPKGMKDGFNNISDIFRYFR